MIFRILIAEFMGYKVMKENDFLNYNYPKNTNLDNIMIDVAMTYHKSWDWLMPVVEKIEGLAIEKYNPIKVEINGTSTYIKKASEPRFNISRAYSVKSRIQATHKAVVEFIKWYNENK